MINKLMISCEVATRLTHKELNGRLGLSDKLRLKLHVKMCVLCLRYKQQQAWIEKCLEHQIKKTVDQKKVEELKKQIIKKVQHG